MEELAELLDDDEPMLADAEHEVARLADALADLESDWLYADPDHPHGAVLCLRAGAGGQEAEFWTQRLMGAYDAWAKAEGLKLTWQDWDPTPSGLRSVSGELRGPRAFGMLRAEHGAHRLSRVSDFDARGRRHTSFCSVEVLAKVPPRGPFELDLADVRMETFRGSGPGGQHRNVTDSAVRAVHQPTQIMAVCARGRSQHDNRVSALQVLAARVAAHLHAAQLPASSAPAAAFGQRIRSYVLNPSQLVCDHRTGVKLGAAVRLLDSGQGLSELMRADALRRRASELGEA